MERLSLGDRMMLEAGFLPIMFNNKGSRKDDDWVTISGTHVLLNENGKAQGGGKLKGKTFSKAKSSGAGTGTGGASAQRTKRMQDKLSKALSGKGSKDDKYGAVRDILKNCEVGSTYRVGDALFTKMKDTDDERESSLALGNSDYADWSFSDMVHMMEYHFTHENDPPEFVDRGKKRAEVQEKISELKKSGELSGTEEMKKLEQGLISKDSPDFGKPGKYVMYRSGKVGKRSGMLFFAPDKAGADTYADLHDGDTVQYSVDIKNPLVVTGSADGECLRKAWQSLHPGQTPPKNLTGSSWKKMDRENASALEGSQYDSIIYKIGDRPQEIQIPAKRGKELEKLATYTTTDWSRAGRSIEDAIFADKFKDDPHDFKRIDSREDSTDDDLYENEDFRYFLCDWKRARHKDDEEWKTINGTHVLVDTETGSVNKGPDGLKKWSESKKPGPNGSGSSHSGTSTEKGLSGAMKPAQTGYDMTLDDGFDDFVRKNMGNRRNPKALYSFYHEVEDNGGDGHEAVKDEYQKSRLAMCTEGLKEISRDEADEILYDNLNHGTVQQWFREYNHEVKDGLVWQMTQSPGVHNAALNIMYGNYKYNCMEEGSEPLPFEQFLVTPIKMYRGGTGMEYDEAGAFSSYTFNRKVAESFTGSEVGQGHSFDPNGVVYEAEIRPIDTYGSVYTNGESEILVPKMIAPNKNRDSADSREDEESARMFSTVELFAMFSVYGNSYTEKKLIDIASRHGTILLGGRNAHGDEKPASWISTEEGHHIPLNKEGIAIGGAGGWATGKDFSGAKSESKSKQSDKPEKKKKPGQKREAPQGGKPFIYVGSVKRNKGTKPKPTGGSSGSSEKPKVSSETGRTPVSRVTPEPTGKSTAEKKRETRPEEKRREHRAEPKKGTAAHPSPRGENIPCTGMKNDNCVKLHEKHYKEVGASGREDYEKKAIDFIKQPCGGDIDGYCRWPEPGSKKKPVIVRFNRKTGEIGFGIPGSFFLSYYVAKYDEATGKTDIDRANRYFDKIKKQEGGGIV